MEYKGIIYQSSNGEFMHWGIKGMRWGVRRYQNKDGTLTAAGRKRYDKEMSKLKKEEEVLKNKQETKALMDKLDETRKNIDSMKESLGEGKKTNKKAKDEDLGDTPEARREKLLKSTDAKELYKHREDLTTQEIQERLNRIGMEKKLADAIREDIHKKTAKDYVDGAMKLAKGINNAYEAMEKSSLGRNILESMGLLKKETTPTMDYALKNPDKVSPEQWAIIGKKAANVKLTTGAMDEIKKYKQQAEDAEKKAKADKEAKEAQVKADKQAKAAERAAEREAGKKAKEAKAAEREAATAEKDTAKCNTRKEVGKDPYDETSASAANAKKTGSEKRADKKFMSDSEIDQIVALGKQGKPAADIAEKVGVSPSTVYNITTGEEWYSELITH